MKLLGLLFGIISAASIEREARAPSGFVNTVFIRIIYDSYLEEYFGIILWVIYSCFEGCVAGCGQDFEQTLVKCAALEGQEAFRCEMDGFVAFAQCFAACIPEWDG